MSRHEQHDNALADALLWLRGFEAATTSDHDDTARKLWTGVRNVRDWLAGLTAGRTRLLGMNEHARAVVLTEAEAERLLDGLCETPAPADVTAARETIEAVFADMRREAAEPDTDMIPF